MIYRKVVNRVDPITKGKKIFFSFFFLLYLQETIDANDNYYNHHFTIYVIQTLLLYTIRLYGDIYQLYLTKTGEGNILLSIILVFGFKIDQFIFIIFLFLSSPNQRVGVVQSWMVPCLGYFFNVYKNSCFLQTGFSWFFFPPALNSWFMILCKAATDIFFLNIQTKYEYN